MRPELLILEGVYSYRLRTEIDFSTLCRADLFGIFGKVGSGKSAILEAVTYVLYGRMERLSNKVYYNMMNLASNRMYIEFIFTSRDKRYRFTFETKRSRKDFEKVDTPKRSGYVMEDGEWVPLFDKDNEVSAEDIVGLSYDNFRRTIIVPQGRFQEFLQLGKKDRTDMLMELFGLDRFNLYSNAARLANRNNEKTASAEGELSGLVDVTASALADAEAEAELLGKQRDMLAAEIAAGEETLKELNELESLSNRLTEARETLTEKSVDRDVYSRRREDLLVYEDCFSKFKSDIDIFRMLKKDSEAAAAELQQAKQQQEAGKKLLEAAQRRFAAAEPGFAEIDGLAERAGWFEELAGLADFRTELDDLKKRLETGSSVKTETFKSKEELNRRLETCKTGADEAGEGLRDPEEINSLRMLYASMNDALEAVAASDVLLKALEEEKTQLAERMSGYSGLEAEEDDLKLREDKLRRKQLDAEIKREFAEAAAGLVDGEPCPVCGAVEHPAPASELSVDEPALEAEAAAIASAWSELKNRVVGFQSLTNEIAAVDGRLRSELERRAEIESGLEEIKFSFNDDYGPGDYEAFRAEADNQAEKRRRRDELREEYARLSEEQERLNSRIARLNETESRMKLEAAALEAKIDSAESRIDEAFLSEYGESENLIVFADELRAEISAARREYTEAENALKDAELQNSKNLAAVELLGRKSYKLGQGLKKAETELKDKIDKSGYDSLEAVEAVLSRSLDPAAERRTIEAYEKGLEAALVEVRGLEQQLGSRIFDKSAFDEALGRQQLLKAKYEKAATRLGELGSTIRNLETGLVRKAEIETELERLRIRGEDLSLLKNIFSGKKFIDYVATVYLRELCESANIRFRKLTRESLRLELDEGNNFIIRDYLNDGKTRSVRTLSGGQTFQAAFSLSLALADRIGRERAGFFFLDEGFGSLDRESLSLVFDSLKSLKKERRTVGIISHVEELKQEIDTCITVVKDSEEGSIINNSWT
ncbi:MAG: SMC family ATPase [Spirochaetales bacterium]|uniref:SMC family ATPase n=1 Tax=Candidatus Thalassospirochaeta sargassi TaxID=3119039 RepID=A0AAJ1ICQ3_9SPIO|nr:SMC family ATPase [Spirochaetales bacterium]